MNKLDLTVIIPVHSVKAENFTEMFSEALKSISENKGAQPEKVLIVRCPCQDVKDVVDNFDYGDLPVEVIENPTGKSFQNQINYGANHATTKYMTYLEFDDTYGYKWFENVDAHIKAYPETEMFIPLVIEMNTEGRRLQYSNAEAWAMSFSDEMGVYDHDVLTEFMNVNICGMVVNREFYLSIGGLKNNIQLYFAYEYLLRVTHKGGRVMVIPHEGYKHLNNREGSLFWLYQNDDSMKITPETAQLWLNAAKTEFYFNEDRDVDITAQTGDNFVEVDAEQPVEQTEKA